MPATRRAATTNDGGENCATSRIERPSSGDTGRNLASVRPRGRDAELVSPAADRVRKRGQRQEGQREGGRQVAACAGPKAALSEEPVLKAQRQSVRRGRRRQLRALEAALAQEPAE